MGWREEHVRLYDDYKILLLGDFTLTTLDEELLVFVRFSRDSYTDFAATSALRRIGYFHPVYSNHGAMVALMTDDTEANVKDTISTKGWIKRVIVKLQRQIRFRLSANWIMKNGPESLRLCSCVDIITHIVGFIPVSAVVATVEMEPCPRDNWASFPTDVAIRREDVRRRRNEGYRSEYLRRLQDHPRPVEQVILLQWVVGRMSRLSDGYY